MHKSFGRSRAWAMGGDEFETSVMFEDVVAFLMRRQF